MRLGHIGATRPEDFPKDCIVYSAESVTSSRGRELMRTDSEAKARIRCVLSIAKVEERERFSQIQKTVTHTLLHGGSAQATENDVIVLVKNGRSFRVQGVHDKGEMGVSTVYYCEERGDGE